MTHANKMQVFNLKILQYITKLRMSSQQMPLQIHRLSTKTEQQSSKQQNELFAE